MLKDVDVAINQSAAYWEAYDAKGMKAATVRRNADALSRHNKITARVAEIRKPIIEQVRYGLKEAMEDAVCRRLHCGTDACYEMLRFAQSAQASAGVKNGNRPQHCQGHACAGQACEADTAQGAEVLR